jgi:hypothetical protein
MGSMSSFCVVDSEKWAEIQFGECQLGDARRTRRAVKVASVMARLPDATTPTQFEKWGDLKAAYRLFEKKDVTFQSLIQPHCQRTRSLAHGVCLVVSDTTETNVGQSRELQAKSLGPTGNGTGRGFLLHSALMIQADTGEVMGLAAQELFYRKPRKRGESYSERLKRERESEVWGRVIDQVGPPAPGVRFLHVGDRGADNAEVFYHCQEQSTGWIIRAAKLNRWVLNCAGKRMKLGTVLKDQPVLGTYQLQVRKAKNQPARIALVEIRASRVTLPAPTMKTPYVKRMGSRPIEEWLLEAREVNPPAGVIPVHWILHVSEPVETFEDAWKYLTYYEYRWKIEEYHKCLKTGCQLESRQYTKKENLEAATGMLSVLAVRLLQMRDLARQQPELPAEKIVPPAWLKMLRALRRKPIDTVRDFFRHLAGLGGFLMRKHDGEPGWITIWRGLEKLHLCLRGARAVVKECG